VTVTETTTATVPRRFATWRGMHNRVSPRVGMGCGGGCEQATATATAGETEMQNGRETERETATGNVSERARERETERASERVIERVVVSLGSIASSVGWNALPGHRWCVGDAWPWRECWALNAMGGASLRCLMGGWCECDVLVAGARSMRQPWSWRRVQSALGGVLLPRACLRRCVVEVDRTLRVMLTMCGPWHVSTTAPASCLHHEMPVWVSSGGHPATASCRPMTRSAPATPPH